MTVTVSKVATCITYWVVYSCCIPVVFLLGGPNSIDCVAVAHCIDILGLINNTVSDSMTYVKYSDEGVNTFILQIYENNIMEQDNEFLITV
jgi:hypothetical protein